MAAIRRKMTPAKSGLVLIVSKYCLGNRSAKLTGSVPPFLPCSCKGAVQHPNCFTCRDRGLICQAGAPRNFQILTGRLIRFRLMPVRRRLVDPGGTSGLKFTSLGTHLPQLLSGGQGKLGPA
jgi:hypothetical protein